MTPLGKLLVKFGYAKEEQIDEALKKQRELGEFKFRVSRSLPSILLCLNKAKREWKDHRLGKILIEMGVVTPEQIEKTLQEQRKNRSKHIGSTLSEFALMEVPSILNSALNVYALLSNVMVLCNTILNSKASALYICDEKKDKLICDLTQLI